ncbi:VOC family protein [Fulvivirgaceae bacterium PWU4]|uniref:VOC family protein n=1 Tax=Chryseosolibacter histidini TaxID=2782349 RepID=A0AAP2GHE7_9BACT|nr:VOC family protein [Chryseosolibacter histidini]MBT1695961.1 VOC family protein [Chryseosolibacter histidini]
MKEKITPCLWYNNQAQEAAALYCSAFADTKIVAKSPIVTAISVAGQSITLLDGGPRYQPNPSVSFFYICEKQDEMDRIWKLFSKGGSVLMPLDKYPWSERYGWITDKYGVSWQLALGKISDVGQKLTPCLLFTGKQYGKADEAIAHYSSIFKDPKVDGILRYTAGESPDEAGKVKHAQMALNGQKFMLMDSAGPHGFTFSEGVSLTIHCDTQAEIDHYWGKLTESGEESMCGWLKDKFGVSWQIIPTILNKIMSDPAKAGKAAQAFMSMRKLDIEQIVQASIA